MKTTPSLKRINSIWLLARVAILTMTVAFLAGCGSKMSGTYAVDGNGGLFKKMAFTSGNKVELTTIFGVTQEATYVVEGDKLKINTAGQIQIFTIDSKGCLNGGGPIGKFCKQ